MARFVQTSRKSLLLSFRNPFLQHHHQQRFLQLNKPISNFLAQFSRTHMSAAPQKSPFESNILRILRTEIDYQSEYAPPHQPDMKFNEFTVEDRPGELWVTLKGKSAGDENIKIEATMFDGSVFVPKCGDDSTGEDVRLHISLLVDISKGEGRDLLEFVCSAWPESLEIQKVYLFRRDGSPPHPYMGPNLRDVDNKLRNALYEFLKARGVNNDLSVFLHKYMLNKDRIELIQWLRNVSCFVEK